MKILVTGGCGFIGSNFIRLMIKKHSIINLDALTYSSNLNNLKDIEKNSNYEFIHGRIEDKKLIFELIKDIDCVVNFAAECHVDRSILEPNPFIITNVVGTQTILEACRKFDVGRIVHISTDEVYGELGEEGKFREDSPLQPNSPYSASKAAADLIARAYHETYALPLVIARPSNTYGYYQHPEKFIPLAITNVLEGKPIPLYGRGENVRDWLFVEDCCSGVALILEKGKNGEAHNIGANNEKKNIDVAKAIIKLLNKGEIRFVEDRPGHDYRYALDNSKISKLGWKPSTNFEEGLAKTVKWYQSNEWWWKPLKRKLARESRGFWT